MSAAASCRLSAWSTRHKRLVNHDYTDMVNSRLSGCISPQPELADVNPFAEGRRSLRGRPSIGRVSTATLYRNRVATCGSPRLLSVLTLAGSPRGLFRDRKAPAIPGRSKTRKRAARNARPVSAKSPVSQFCLRRSDHGAANSPLRLSVRGLSGRATGSTASCRWRSTAPGCQAAAEPAGPGGGSIPCSCRHRQAGRHRARWSPSGWW